MRVLLLFILALGFNSTIYAQERIIDLEIKIVHPDSGYYFISPGMDSVTYFMINHGPDTIFPSDGYITYYKLANVTLGPTIDYVGSTILPGDSMYFKHNIELKYYNHRPSVDFCVWTYVYASDKVKIFREKDSAEMYLNNAPCTLVGHNRIETGAVQVIDNQKLKVFPNPSTGIINIETEEKLLVIKIYNLEGQVMNASMHIEDSVARLDCTALVKGVYVLEVCTDGSCLKQKIIIID